MGSAIYQIQNGQLRLTAYTSKSLPVAAQNYSITELGLYGLATDITMFSYLLKRVNFDVVVDHLALTPIMKNKSVSATNNIK